MEANNALEQLDPAELAAVASLIGFGVVTAGFKNYLREMPPLPGLDLTIGDFARAYLKARLKALAK